MGQINKGRIASIKGNTARVVPSDAGAKPTANISLTTPPGCCWDAPTESGAHISPT